MTMLRHESTAPAGQDEPLAPRTEAALRESLLELGRAEDPSPADREPALAAIARVETRARTRRRTAAGLAAIAAAAAALAVKFGQSPDLEPPAARMVLASTPEPIPAPRIAISSGALLGAAGRMESGAPVGTGAWLEALADLTCIAAAPGRACFTSGARVRLTAGDTESGTPWVDVELGQGRAQIETHAAGMRARTAASTFSSEVGRYEVEITDAGVVVVVVLVGPVTLADGTVLQTGERRRLGEVERSAPAAHASSPTPNQLLKRGRARLNAGDTRGAASAYRALIEAHPKSPEALPAAVRLGHMELRLGRARAALRSFDHYLSRGGPLAEEARVGRLRALAKLGRTVELEREAKAFLGEFSGSLYADEVRGLAGE